MMKHGGLLVGLLFLLLTGCSAAHFHPVVQGNCVDRAVAIREYLKEEGYQAEIVLGIVQDPATTQVEEAHAWVKYRKTENEQWETIKNLREKR